MDTQSRYFRLHRKDIAYFKFVIEAHEGMAVVRTKDPHEAVVELMVAPGWEKDVEEVLEGLRKEIQIENLSNSQFQNPCLSGRHRSKECQSPKLDSETSSE